MDCGTKCVRGLFIGFNLLFWLLGLAVLGVGVYSRTETDSWKDLIDGSIYQSANLLISAGTIVAVIGFLGCCGAVKKWQWMLVLYSVLVLIIFTLEIIAGAYSYKNLDKVENKLAESIRKTVNTNYGQQGKASEGLTKGVDWFQEQVECCGSTGPADWKSTLWYANNRNNNNTDVPITCCKTQTPGCNEDIASKNTVYTAGCVSQSKTFAQNNMWLVGGVGIGVAVVQLLGIWFALCLCCAFKKEDEVVGIA